jgi:amidophosphoribosyltransferase
MCGVIGVWNEHRPAGSDAFWGCRALQHRGRGSGGVAVYDEESGYIHRQVGMGEIPQVFMGRSASSLRGRVAIGHVRYPNTGPNNLENAQPAFGYFRGREFAIGHNGNLVNTQGLKRSCELSGISLNQECSDTKVIAAMISRSRAATFKDALLEVLPKLEGAFCLVALHEGKIYAARDPYGFHPLQLGIRGNDHLVASESCAIDHLSVETDEEQKIARFVREIEPGEMLVIGDCGVEPMSWSPAKQLSFDIFELIYFLRPDSTVYDIVVAIARRKMGYYLAEEHGINGLVVPVNSSGSAAAWGYHKHALELGYDVEYEPDGLFRPNDSGRVWTEAVLDVRLEYLGSKFNVIEELVRGRELIVVDDSIVRGETMPRIVKLLRRAGARKVHVRVSSDQYRFPDIYGNATYADYLKNNLIARRFNGNVTEIAQAIGADSLGYLSLDSVKQAILDVIPRGSSCPLTKDSFHDAVFTGEYRAGTGDFDIK